MQSVNNIKSSLKNPILTAIQFVTMIETIVVSVASLQIVNAKSVCAAPFAVSQAFRDAFTSRIIFFNRVIDLFPLFMTRPPPIQLISLKIIFTWTNAIRVECKIRYWLGRNLRIPTDHRAREPNGKLAPPLPIEPHRLLRDDTDCTFCQTSRWRRYWSGSDCLSFSGRPGMVYEVA